MIANGCNSLLSLLIERIISFFFPSFCLLVVFSNFSSLPSVASFALHFQQVKEKRIFK